MKNVFPCPLRGNSPKMARSSPFIFGLLSRGGFPRFFFLSDLGGDRESVMFRNFFFSSLSTSNPKKV